MKNHAHTMNPTFRIIDDPETLRLIAEKRLLGDPGNSDSAPLEVFISVVIDEVATEIRRSVQSGLIDLDRTHEDVLHPCGLVLGRKWYRFTPERLATYRDAVAALDAEFAPDQIRNSTPNATAKDLPAGATDTTYESLIGFYPIVPPSSSENRLPKREEDSVS